MKKRIAAVLLVGMMALQGSVCYAAGGESFSDGAEYAAAALTAESGQEMAVGENSGEDLFYGKQQSGSGKYCSGTEQRFISDGELDEFRRP